MARRVEKKLTVLGAKALSKPGFHSDGAGLYLRIEGGRRLWVFRYKKQGVSRWLSLGPDRDVTLSEAREGAATCRRQMLAGVDPLEARRATQAEREAAQGQTFRVVAEQYIAAHRAGWKNEKHGAQWGSTLKAYAYAVIGEKPVAAITVADVLAILEPIWRDKPETASRVRGRVESVLDFAKARKMRSGENPAAWAGNLDQLLPARAKVARVAHHAAVPYADLPAVMAKLAGSTGTAAHCLCFAVLTAARSGEARGATWAEIDLEAATWTIPAERMKAGQAHRVPLAPAAIAVLKAQMPVGASAQPVEGFVFRGGRVARPLSDVALAKALRVAGGGNYTVHGMRSTFRDWCAEATNYPREIAEASLAHSNRDRVEAAYQRTDFFEKRRRLMEAWSAFATGPARGAAAAADNVLALRA